MKGFHKDKINHNERQTIYQISGRQRYWSGFQEDSQQLAAWIEHYQVQDFSKAISAFLRTNEASVTLHQMGTIKVYLSPICEFYGISPEQLLEERSKLIVPD